MAYRSLPEVDVDPLGDIMLDFLIERDREDTFVDFKETISIAKNAPFAKLAKDIFAFSNYGGGFILIGFQEGPKVEVTASGSRRAKNFIPVGLPEDFHIDQADLQAKFNSYSNVPIELQYREFVRIVDSSSKKLAAIYIPPSTCVMRPVKDGVYIDERGKTRTAFKAGSIYFRRGTQSIIATKEEVAWIEKRAEKQGYRLSVLSGQPDPIQEILYGNLFEVIKFPQVIWTAEAKLESQGEFSKHQELPTTCVYVYWNNRIVTFQDISEPSSPLWSIVKPSSVRMEEVAGWLDDEDRQRVVMQLLNKEVRFLAKRLGLLHEPGKHKFYYSCDGDYRVETWTSRFRRSSRLTVAQRIWAQQLKRFIFWHVAVTARFTFIDGKLFLRLTPTLQLTTDGRRAIFGQKEGTVITKLTYNRYNSSYLNSVLFWISRFAEGKEQIELAQGKVVVSAKPVECLINIGIMADRPSAEPVQEVPVEIEEER